MNRKRAKSLSLLSAATKPTETDHADIGLERLVFFSDAVFAIAITLLALEIRLPTVAEELTNQQLLQMLLAIWPSYLGYAISFLVIGVFWIGHHRRFRFITRYDTTLILLNLLLLMIIAFIPFPTVLISEYGNRTATIFYALTVSVAGLFSLAIWGYAAQHNRLIDPHLTPQQKRRELLRTLVIPVVFLLSVGLAFINDDLAKFSWVLTVVVAKFI